MATFSTLFWLTLGTVISCSLTTFALCASLLSWLYGLSPHEHRSVREAFDHPSLIFGFAFISPSLLLASFIMMLVLTGQLPNYLGFCLFIFGVGGSIMYYSVANWRPCLIMSHIEHSPSPTAIPGATSACRQMNALNALSVINLFSALVFMYEVAGMKLCASESAPVNPNNDDPQEDNEVDLRDMAHHLDALDNA